MHKYKIGIAVTVTAGAMVIALAGASTAGPTSTDPNGPPPPPTHDMVNDPWGGASEMSKRNHAKINDRGLQMSQRERDDREKQRNAPPAGTPAGR